MATVVPILTVIDQMVRHGCIERQSERAQDARHRGVGVTLRIFAQHFDDRQSAVRPARHHIGEGAAAIDPELPACGHEGLLHVLRMGIIAPTMIVSRGHNSQKIVESVIVLSSYVFAVPL